MSSSRLLAALIVLFLGSTALNYIYYMDKLSAIKARAASPVGSAVNVLERAVGVTPQDTVLAARERTNFMYREVAIGIVAGVGLIVFSRRSNIRS